jgi:organic radical activating enzyme
MNINIQPIEKRVGGDGFTLDVHSIFYTIQGEGPHTGRPAVFLRLAGCNLQCPGCDTEYTEGRETLSIQEITARIERSYSHIAFWHTPMIVITGGEPFRQNIAELCKNLTRYYHVQIETNGTLGIEDPTAFRNVDIVCSPKSGKIHYSILSSANWYKYVLHHESVSEADGLPILALDHSASPQVCRPPVGAPVYLQPMDCKNDRINRLNMEAVLKSCLKYGYILQIQTHKIIGIE